MTKYEVIITESAKKDLKAIERVDSEYVQKIIQKIEFCLSEYLFAPIKQCNKKKLKGGGEYSPATCSEEIHRVLQGDGGKR